MGILIKMIFTYTFNFLKQNLKVSSQHFSEILHQRLFICIYPSSFAGELFTNKLDFLNWKLRGKYER